jgi:uncharacterized protein (DUF697 family)
MSWLDTVEGIRKGNFTAATPEERERAARGVVNMCSHGCAAVSVSPIPFTDVVLLLPLQVAMVMAIANIYGRKLSSADARTLLAELTTTAGAGLLARQGVKVLLPVVGALLTIPAAFAANWAIGRVAIEHYKNPSASAEQLRRVYQEARREGRSLFSWRKLRRFRAEDTTDRVGQAERPR